MKACAFVEARIAPPRGAKDVGGEAAIAGAGFDEIKGTAEFAESAESGTVLCALWVLGGFVSRIPAISAIWISSSSPKIGPTSTLVKKSPARPDRWAARA